MRHQRLFASGFAALAALALSIAPVRAQTTAAGPYYATPSWDQKLTPATRFVVLSNWNGEAVLDRETGLVWERTPDPFAHFWDDAIRLCRAKKTGNRMGWRLPILEELHSLIDPAAAVSFPGPALPPGYPFNALATSYWSATAHLFLEGNFWGLIFNDGAIFQDPRLQVHHVWCVRGGQGPLAQP